MKAAQIPIQRPLDAKLLVVDGQGCLHDGLRKDLIDFLRPGDLLVANDAATMPASLTGTHVPSGATVELRLAARPTLATEDVQEFTAVVFGAGDHRTRTEDRPLPPPLTTGDELELGPLTANVLSFLGHARLIVVRFTGTPDQIWAGIASHGKPIQYAHIQDSLDFWDVWTRVAALPVAFEPPSASFVLDWKLLEMLGSRGVEFATLTHAAGISSTGDPALDARLPLDEPYQLPIGTVKAIKRTRSQGGRVIALGTTVTRALEHAAHDGSTLVAGPGLATQHIGPDTHLQVVDAIISGAHERGESHHQLLRAFVPDLVLGKVSSALEAGSYRSHEFGDSVFIEKSQFHSPF